MSVKELILKDHPIEIKIAPAVNIEGALVFRITWMENKLTACIDRNQAYLLMLYLQEHLK